MIKYLLLTTSFFITQIGFTQVLFTEDFNNYLAGHLNIDYTGTIVGQGGWVTERHVNASAIAMVTPETGKGNVVSFTTNGNFSNENVNVKQNTGVISALWNNRTAGNNVLKYEYEVYATGWFNAYGNLYNNNSTLMYLRFASTTVHYIQTTCRGMANPNTQPILKNYTASTFPHNMWIKVEFFIDYNNKKAYWYIPILNIFRSEDLANTFVPDNLSIYVDWLKPGTVVKYDNIKLTALASVPTYILSANEIVSAKFNMYPNPATNVVNIINSENMLVEQVTVYDISGKQLITQSFSNQTQIQLNVENLASGTYMLHIQTNVGLAVKKLVKQ